MSNKRKDRRIGCIVPVDGKGTESFGESKIVDFSRGGLGFVSRRRVPLNREIAIQLDLSKQGNPAFVKGLVKWVQWIQKTKNFRVGVSFEAMPKESKSSLDNYFRQRKDSFVDELSDGKEVTF